MIEPNMKPRSAAQDKKIRRLSDIEVVVPFENNIHTVTVAGFHDQNLAYLEQRFDVFITAVGNHVVIRGAASVCDQVKRILQKLYAMAVSGVKEFTFSDIDGAIREEEADMRSAAEEPFRQENTGIRDARKSMKGFEGIYTRKKGNVKARTETQSSYIQVLRDKELVFAEGPAGTGKTWLAVGYAVSLLEQGQVDRLILTRPAVEAGERLGFLPGDMKEKVDPYLRPIYDALYDFMEARHVERGLQTGMIEIAPLAFMRGRTLSNAVILLDEAQNTTSMQMKMFLTRLGEGSRMIVTGDPSQIDLPAGQKSGLIEASALLRNIEGIARIRFKAEDVVRHDLVRRIVAAYDTAYKARDMSHGDNKISRAESAHEVMPAAPRSTEVVSS